MTRFMTDDQIIAIVNNPKFSHARSGKGLWRNIVYLYVRDSESPSGVTKAGADIESAVEPILRKYKNNSPLSPYER